MCGKEATVVHITYGLYGLNIELEDNPDNIPELAYSESELEMIEQKPKTKIVRKYACVCHSGFESKPFTVGSKFYSENELKKFEKDVQDATKSFEMKIDEAVSHKEKEVLEV